MCYQWSYENIYYVWVTDNVNCAQIYVLDKVGSTVNTVLNSIAFYMCAV